MVLQPRKFLYKLRHKKRRIAPSLNSFTLNFGSLGLCLLSPLRLNSRKLFRLKLFIKRSARKGDHTSRRAWLNTFPHVPLTKKPLGSRMGKSKGKLSMWSSQLYTGSILVEFRNLRFGRALYYLLQLNSKLKGSFRAVYAKTFRNNVFPPVSRSKHSPRQVFW